MAIKKLTSFAAFESTQTQKRALSFLKPTVTRSAYVPTNEDIVATGTRFNFFKAPEVSELKKPIELLHDLKLMQLRDQAQKRGHLNMFWGNNSGNSKADWEGWLREKILPRAESDGEQAKPAANGWTGSADDLSDIEDEEFESWLAGGTKRPSDKTNEEFSSEEVDEDDYITTDNEDDDDRGGHMMPSAI